MLGILASAAAFEIDLRAARQKEGIRAAMERGVKFGRNAKLTDEMIAQIEAMRAEGRSIREVMEATGLSKSSLMRARRSPESKEPLEGLGRQEGSQG